MAAQGDLPSRIREELHRYVFNELPIHLIHLQSAQLCDRHTIFERFLPVFGALTAQDFSDGLRVSLLNPVPSSTDTTSIHNFIRSRLRYAILSDEWGKPVPAYGDVPGLALLAIIPAHYDVAKFCDIARNYDMEYAWVDSCCIDRSSDAEFNRSIRSMYRWYANSSICIVHLADAVFLGDISRDTWFRGGWALMQLLAPERLKFYNRRWDPLTEYLNDKWSPTILAAIEHATSITALELHQFEPSSPDTYHISKRMRWAANRRTTIAEDRAYSLMGVFGVIIDIAYGEGGSRAFSRLFQEIVHFSNSPEVVNWIGKPAAGLSLRSLAFPSSPDAFVGSSDIAGLFREEAVSLAANGLSIKLLVLPATLVSWERDIQALLKCFEAQVRVECILDFKPGDPREGEKLEYAFGGWNFSTIDGRCERAGDMIEAILLYRVVRNGGSRGIWSRIPTQSFIRIELQVANPPPGRRWEDYIQTVVF